MPYTYSEDLTTSDAGFFAWGESVAEMCAAACDALAEVMVTDLSQIRNNEHKDLDLQAESVDLLLRECLNAIIFYKDAEGLLLRLNDPVAWQAQHNLWRLRGKAIGEAIDPERHDIGVDVKAITYHNFSVEKKDQGWQAAVVVDV